MAEKPPPIKKLSDKSTKQEMLGAEKTVEGSSQSKSLAELQRLLIEQGRKSNVDKG
jgi:hypothetical protein